MVVPCRCCLHPQLYFIVALYTAFSRGRWPRLKAFFLIVRDDGVHILISTIFLLFYYYTTILSLFYYHNNKIVTPPTRHPMWMSSEGATLRDCDSLTFSLSAFRVDTCIHMHNLCNNKNSFYIYTYTYHHSDIHYILYTYTRVPLLVLLQFY